jgi:hypothetical protein
VRPISWILAPTWGMNAIRESSLGGSPLPDLLLCFALGPAYIALAVLVMDRLLDARAARTLSLTVIVARASSSSAGSPASERSSTGSRPWIYIPSLIVAPIFQILLFAYIGRSPGSSRRASTDRNAIQYAAIPCLFAMSQTVGGRALPEHAQRDSRQPGHRGIPLFFGRPCRSSGNGAFVAAFSLARGRARPRRPPAAELARAALARRPDRALLLHGPRARRTRRRALRSGRTPFSRTSSSASC